MKTLLLSLVVLIIMRTEATSKCQRHAFYQRCKDLCPKRCNKQKEVRCSNACVPGCSCNLGYELNYLGHCVKPKYCNRKSVLPHNKVCPVGSHFRICADTCPKKCNEPRPTNCNLMCKLGCSCDPGLELNSLGLCVAPHLCEPPKK